MPTTLTITVENPEQILNAGLYGTGALVRLQSSATQAGTFADVSGTGSTPTLAVVAGTRAYTGYDPNGITSTWYRTRYENSGATRASDWTVAFQASGLEGDGLLCSIYDVKQRLGLDPATTTEDEDILQFIGQVSAAIMSYTERRFARTPASGTTTYLFDVDQWTNTVSVPQGIAELTLLEYATATGGSFATIASTDYFLDPPVQDRDFGWPATRITLSDVPASGPFYLYRGKRVVRATMALGWATIPVDIAGVAIRAVVSNYLAKGSGSTGPAIVGPTGAMTILRDIAPSDMSTLTRYKPLLAA